MKTPNSWNDITVGQYQELLLVETENKISQSIEKIAIICDCDPEDIRALPYGEYLKLSEKLSFIDVEPKGEVETKLEIDGIVYGLEPEMNLMSAGVFTDGEQFKQDPIVNLHLTLALIYRPITKDLDDSYEIEPHKAQGFEKRANLFRDRLSIQTVLGACLFFSTLGIELSIISLESFNTMMKEEVQTMTTAMTPTPTKTRKQKRSKKGGVSTTQ